MNTPLTAFAGHRALDETFFPLVLDAVQAAMERQSGLVVGCCTGADEQVIRAAMMLNATHRLVILAAFGPQGEGACELSAVDTVLKATALGTDVRFFAGGPVEQPLDARLVARTRAVIAEAAALVAFFGRPNSRGTFLAVRAAVAAGLPVIAFACGMDPAYLPRPGSGAWVAAGDVATPGALAWRAAVALQRPLAVTSWPARRTSGAGGPR